MLEVIINIKVCYELKSTCTMDIHEEGEYDKIMEPSANENVEKKLT